MLKKILQGPFYVFITGFLHLLMVSLKYILLQPEKSEWWSVNVITIYTTQSVWGWPKTGMCSIAMCHAPQDSMWRLLGLWSIPGVHVYNLWMSNLLASPKHQFWTPLFNEIGFKMMFQVGRAQFSSTAISTVDWAEVLLVLHPSGLSFVKLSHWRYSTYPLRWAIWSYSKARWKREGKQENTSDFFDGSAVKHTKAEPT